MSESIVDYHNACLEEPIEGVIELWHNLLVHRSGYPEWAQARDVIETIQGSPLYSRERELEVYRSYHGLV